MSSTPTGTVKRKKRGKGGCCGCLIVLILLLGGSLWLVRKWAPNHLNRGLAWSRTQTVAKYPALDRWLPKAPGATPPSVFEPTTAPPQPTVPSPTPPSLTSPSPTPQPVATTLDESAPMDMVVGTGQEAKLGQTVMVRYSANKPAELPEIFMLGTSDVSEELDRAVRGMRVGGKRKLAALEVELVKML
nr:hypothetical protein [Armatimonas sp.]